MLKNVINIFSVSAISSGVRFLVEVIIARIVSVEAFGLFALITSFISIFQVLLSGGIRPIIQRKLAITIKTNAFEFFEILLKSLSLFFIVILAVFFLFIFLDIIPYKSVNISIIETHFKIIFIGSIATAALYIVSDIFRVLGELRSFIFYKEAIFPISFLILICMAWIANLVSIQHILFALILSLFFSCVVGIIRLKKKISEKTIEKNINGSRIFTNKKLFLFWISFEVLGVLWVIRDKFAILSISEYMTAEDIAVLFVMIRLMMPISMIKSSFNSIISPIIAHLYFIKSFDKLNFEYSQLSKHMFLFIFPLFVIISSYGPELASIILGEKYKLDLMATSLLAWCIAVSAILGPSGVALQMCGRPNIESFFLILSLIIITPLSMYLVPYLGVLGAVLSVFMLITFMDLLRYIYVKKSLNINAHEKVFGCKILLIMVTALISIILNLMLPIVNCLASILIYLILFKKEIFLLKKDFFRTNSEIK